MAEVSDIEIFKTRLRYLQQTGHSFRVRLSRNKAGSACGVHESYQVPAEPDIAAQLDTLYAEIRSIEHSQGYASLQVMVGEQTSEGVIEVEMFTPLGSHRKEG